MEAIVSQTSSGLRSKSEQAIWGAVLIVWFVLLCFVPDPRPLAAPEWSVKAVRTVAGLSDPGARAVATIGLRAAGLGLLGILFSLTLCSVTLRWAVPTAIVGAPLLAIASQWANYGYFPIATQIQLGVVSAVIGALAGFGLLRSRIAMIAAVIVTAGVFVWGTSTGITDDLYQTAAATGNHLLAHADEFPDGDEGFEAMLREAFVFAEDNSHGTDAVLPNQAAILALGVILGEERVAEVAKRPIKVSNVAEFEKLRRRVTLRGRNDLARHFWVSASLAILADENRSMTVGITKEMMDSTPGGSGFSFVDLTADRAGTLLAVAATKNADAATEMQMRVRRGLKADDVCPEIDGLPEGITQDEFQTKYGGLGGAESGEIVKEIQSRLAKCKGLVQPR